MTFLDPSFLRALALGSAGLLLAALYSTAAAADTDGIRRLIAVTQQKANDANDEAQKVAEAQRKVIEQQKLRAEKKKIEAMRAEAAERFTIAMEAADAMLAISAISSAAAAASAFCSSESKGLKPLVTKAQSKAEVARRAAVVKAEEVQKLIEQKKTEAEKQPLRERLKLLKSGATRQVEIAAQLRAIAQEIAKLKPCTG